MKLLKNIFLYIWQLPQHIVGLLILLFLKGEQKHQYLDIKYFYCKGFGGGISLGNYLIVNRFEELSIRHEYGHHIQSLYLGPLYLIIIGIPSIIWAALYGPVIKRTYQGYFKFYTEKWADKLVGIERKPLK